MWLCEENNVIEINFVNVGWPQNLFESFHGHCHWRNKQTHNHMGRRSSIEDTCFAVPCTHEHESMFDAPFDCYPCPSAPIETHIAMADWWWVRWSKSLLPLSCIACRRELKYATDKNTSAASHISKRRVTNCLRKSLWTRENPFWVGPSFI